MNYRRAGELTVIMHKSDNMYLPLLMYCHYLIRWLWFHVLLDCNANERGINRNEHCLLFMGPDDMVC